MSTACEQKFKRRSDGAVIYAAMPSALYPGWWIVSEYPGGTTFVPDTAMKLQYERITVPACERCGHIPPYVNDWKFDGSGNRIFDYPADGTSRLHVGSFGKFSILCAGCIDTMREETTAAHRRFQEESQRLIAKRHWARSFFAFLALFLFFGAVLVWRIVEATS